MIGGAKTTAPPTEIAECDGANALEDVEDVELEDLFRPEETAEKVKAEGFLLGCDGVMLANEVCGDPIDAADVDTGESVCVAIDASSLEDNAAQI
jgi:hypothetical protein